jgi:hypothetical protein
MAPRIHWRAPSAPINRATAFLADWRLAHASSEWLSGGPALDGQLTQPGRQRTDRDP